MSWQCETCDTACGGHLTGICDGPASPKPFTAEDHVESMVVYLNTAERAWDAGDTELAAWWWQMAGECWSLAMTEGGRSA